MNRTKGFTLIELLTVIAIIAILAAIIFPVFARARYQAYRSSDISNMNSLRTAMQLYRTDQGGYPPRLLGYVTGYSNITPTAADIVPADRMVGALFPKRVDSLDTLRPAQDRGDGGPINQLFTTAVWPNAANISGDALANQRYGPETTVSRPAYAEELAKFGQSGTCTALPAYFYKVSGYDAAEVQTSGGRVELRYTPFWTGYTVPADPCNPTTDESGSGSDDPRQLGYADPPDTTVITWNSFYRDYTNGQPDKGKNEIVLFLGGSARPFDSKAISDLSYQVKP